MPRLSSQQAKSSGLLNERKCDGCPRKEGKPDDDGNSVVGWPDSAQSNVLEISARLGFKVTEIAPDRPAQRHNASSIRQVVTFGMLQNCVLGPLKPALMYLFRFREFLFFF